MTTTPPAGDWDRNDGPLVHRPPTVPPEDYRPVRPQSATGPEQTYVRDGKRYTYRQVGWHGQTGAFYALDERPQDHEPGSYSPMHTLISVEPIIEPDDGLYAKYDVRRTDGREKPDARYFVLDYAGDPAARHALATYAAVCQADRPELAEHLRAELAQAAVERMTEHAPVLLDIRPHLAGLNCRPGDVVVLALTVDVNITDGGPVATEPMSVAKRVDRVGCGVPQAVVDAINASPPAAGTGERFMLSPGERITDPDRAEALGLTVEARRLRAARASSPDADALFIHVDDAAGTLNLTQTTGRTLAVSVNGGAAQVDDRRRHTISYRTGDVVDAEPIRCDMVNDVHVMPHRGCILR